MQAPFLKVPTAQYVLIISMLVLLPTSANTVTEFCCISAPGSRALRLHQA